MPRPEEFMDPLEIMIRREEKTCKGCTYLDLITVVDASRPFCRLRQMTCGERCRAYEERKSHRTEARA